MVRQLLFLFLIFGIVGCALSEKTSYHAIREKAARVDLTDGVSDYEAVALAQNFIVSRGLADRLYSLKPLSVEQKTFWVSEEGRVEFAVPPENFDQPLQKYWMVLFRDKEGSQFFGAYPVIPFYVKVDAVNGEVIRWGLKTDEVK